MSEDAESSRVRVGKKAAAVVLAGLLAGATVVPQAAQAMTLLQATSQAAGSVPDKPDGESGDMGGGSGSGMGDMGGGSAGGGANTQTFDYSGSYSATLSATDGEEATSDSQTISATESLVNAIAAQGGATLTVTNATVTKSGDASDGDSCNFYGVNSIVLAVGEGSQVYLSESSLSADSEGSNAVFATDSATAYVNNVTISTTSDNSRALDATYDGTIVANQITATTEGDHCATVATDRGGGNVSVANSTLTTGGSGSPILYSTGCVEVDCITGTATGSQIAGMEGLNTIRIANSTLTSTITDKTASDPIANGIIIYQSTSGDADTSTGEAALFEARDSTLSSSIQSGSMFYLTNTTADIVLSNTTLDFDTSAACLLIATGNDDNSWGTAGSNGAAVTLTAIDQVLEGTIQVDAISSLDLYLTEGSTYTGATQIVDNESGGTSDGTIDVVVDSTSTWVLTGDATVTTLQVADGGQVVDADGNAVTIVANGETVVEGSSSITLTVTDSYSSTADLSGAKSLSEATIDRDDFDSYYGTSTAFDTNGSSDDATAEADAAETDSDTNTEADATETEEETADESSGGTGIFAWFAGLWETITSFFS